jgi:2-polyprenyl-3-methyl-5-hydroxy-6-metoxy-1,4-benzoquinol methylase
VFVYPSPTHEELLRIYTTDKASIANSDSWTQVRDYENDPQAVRDYYFRSRINWIIEKGALNSPEASILDVGCAVGMLLRTLKDTGYPHVHGMDLSELHCDFVRKTHGIPCDASLDAVPDGAFDLVNCCGVLEHAPDPVAFCKEMARKLKPNGFLVLQVPNYDSYYRKLAGASWLWLIPPVHLQYFGDASLELTIRKAGLRTTTRDSWYNGTYVYLLVYHLMRIMGKPMVGTQRTGRPAVMAVVNAVEATVRACLYPAALIARRRLHHNELDFIVCKDPETESDDHTVTALAGRL